MLYAGLRIGEVCALNLGDIQLSERKGAATVRRGKGRKQRDAPLNKDVRLALTEWLAQRQAWLQELGVQSQALFVGQMGGRLGARAVQHRLKAYGKQAQVEVTPHILRHTCAKRLLEAGVSEFEVAAILGHKSLETTRRYGKPGKHDLQHAVEKLVD